jgi:hypothetical protein
VEDSRSCGESYFLGSPVKEYRELAREVMCLRLIKLVVAIPRLFFFVVLAFALKMGTGLLSGQAAPFGEDPPPSTLDVFLLTVGPGDAIWERFGHNALVFHDTSDGTMTAYNWGIFDFRQHDFVIRLARGRMRYSMRGFPALELIESYRAQDRSVWSQRVNLTDDQKLELVSLVTAMDTEDNRYYRYDYYRDNCSTRIRDALDHVLGGQISRATKQQDAGSTYRRHTARILENSMPAYLGIQFVVGNLGDAPISIWDEMFLPLSMKEHMQSISNPDMGLYGVRLLDPPEVVVESSINVQRENIDEFQAGFLLVGLALGFVFLLCGWRASTGHEGARWFLHGLGSLWSVVIGTLGTLLLMSWFLTDHLFWSLNENIFQANPSSLFLGIVLLVSLRYPMSRRSRRIAGVVATVSILGMIAQVLPGFDQVNGEVMALTLPAHLGLYSGLVWSKVSLLSGAEY